MDSLHGLNAATMQQYVAEKQNLQRSYVLVTRVKPSSNLKTYCVLKTCTTVTLVTNLTILLQVLDY